MNVEQQLFSVIYAVLYAAMLSSLTGLSAFPWGGISVRNGNCRRAIWRLIFSVLVFNVLPFLQFALGLKVLEFSSDRISFWSVLWIGFASLSVYGPYRLYHSFMVWRKHCSYGLYELDEYKEVVEIRRIKDTPLGHFFGALFYWVLFLFLLGV